MSIFSRNPPGQVKKMDVMEQDAMTFHLRPKPKKYSEVVQCVLAEPDHTGWGKILDCIRKYDEDRMADVKEDIDALLTLAGLFSAVMTTFVIDAYTRLMRDQDTANLTNGLSNSILPSNIPSQSPTTSSPATTRINVLWSCSLILSLVTASLGVYTKQCIHSYMSLEHRSPLVQLRVRFFCDDGLATFKVWEMAALLPVLMQISILLFLIGFAEFIIGLSPIAGWARTGIMIA
ncbi:hypothetical protein QCA50_018907 [Cerrena zonata]|uniref:DUF6535 domain-containing protein n=1 Tax=Cerrena zonata TaxID=2478898 RepID=A0AAW0FIX5_9APHY